MWVYIILIFLNLVMIAVIGEVILASDDNEPRQALLLWWIVTVWLLNCVIAHVFPIF